MAASQQQKKGRTPSFFVGVLVARNKHATELKRAEAELVHVEFAKARKWLK